jgi:2-iminobutanoate/2-iminopropanoate deaminase
MAPGGIKAQVRQTLENIRVILEEAGTSLGHVVKVNVYLRDLADFKAYDEAYGEYFDADGLPARTTVPGADLPGDMLVEIDAVAYVPEE